VLLPDRTVVAIAIVVIRVDIVVIDIIAVRIVAIAVVTIAAIAVATGVVTALGLPDRDWTDWSVWARTCLRCDRQRGHAENDKGNKSGDKSFHCEPPAVHWQQACHAPKLSRSGRNLGEVLRSLEEIQNWSEARMKTKLPRESTIRYAMTGIASLLG
jgi:hypothetical protein